MPELHIQNTPLDRQSAQQEGVSQSGVLIPTHVREQKAESGELKMTCAAMISVRHFAAQATHIP